MVAAGVQGATAAFGSVATTRADVLISRASISLSDHH
jgi:hypothetical protein